MIGPVVAGIDLTPIGRRVADRGRMLAEQRGLPLHLVSVNESAAEAFLDDGLGKLLLDQHRQHLEEVAEVVPGPDYGGGDSRNAARLHRLGTRAGGQTGLDRGGGDVGGRCRTMWSHRPAGGDHVHGRCPGRPSSAEVGISKGVGRRRLFRSFQEGGGGGPAVVPGCRSDGHLLASRLGSIRPWRTPVCSTSRSWRPAESACGGRPSEWRNSWPSGRAG